jgi:hypothetical protein
MEYFLDIYESEDYDGCESGEEDDEEGEHVHTHKKKKGEEKKVKKIEYFLKLLNFSLLAFYI